MIPSARILDLPPLWRRRHLSPAEQKVVSLICSGLPTKLAAAQLDRSPLTVRNQLNNAMRKLGVTNRYELMVRMRNGTPASESNRPGGESGLDSFVYTI